MTSQCTTLLTEKQIGKMCLFDIVNFLKLSFPVPGGDAVIDFWIQETSINTFSKILDVACSTGFISRSIVKKTGCSGIGIDIDPHAINVANSIKEEEHLDNLLSYSVQDMAQLHFGNSIRFSHILFGNALAFIEEKNRNKAISIFSDYLLEDGLLLVNSMFYKDKGNPSVIADLATMIGLKVHENCNYEYWNELLEKKFILIIEGEMDNVSNYYIDEDLVRLYVEESLSSSKAFRRLPNHIQKCFFNRLLTIRVKSNENHRNIDARAQVWKKR